MDFYGNLANELYFGVPASACSAPHCSSPRLPCPPSHLHIMTGAWTDLRGGMRYVRKPQFYHRAVKFNSRPDTEKQTDPSVAASLRVRLQAPLPLTGTESFRWPWHHGALVSKQAEQLLSQLSVPQSNDPPLQGSGLLKSLCPPWTASLLSRN